MGTPLPAPLSPVEAVVAADYGPSRTRTCDPALRHPVRLQTGHPAARGRTCVPPCARAAAWCAAAIAVYIAVTQLIWGGEDVPDATLHDPHRLREVLRQFTGAGASAHAANQPPPSRQQRHRTEAQCRDLLEWMLQMDLPKSRPEWLVNPSTRRRLELDMYNAKHGIAFEYDGAQHDVYTPHWHRGNENHFAYRCLLDQLKEELCRENGVRLMRIPWTCVSAGQPERTARYLERLLYASGIPFRSPLVTADGPLARSQCERRCPSPQSRGHRWRCALSSATGGFAAKA